MKLPFLVGASWTDSVMSFWLAGRIGLSDSACFLFVSLLNCLRSAQVRNFLTVTCSKSKHFSRYRRNSSSSVRRFFIKLDDLLKLDQETHNNDLSKKSITSNVL